MSNRKSARIKLITLALTLSAAVTAALGGPPLICFPFHIGDARSLPWGQSADHKSWNRPDEGYNLRQLTRDTLELLGDGTSVIVRMETLRRAAIYAAKDRAVSGELLIAFKKRAEAAKDARGVALSFFDYGYLVETLKQADLDRKVLKDTGLLTALQGYPFIQKAIQQRGGDPQIEFAAALVTAWPRNEYPNARQEHLKKAVAGAETDELLAENLLDYYSDRGKNLAQLRASVAADGQKD